MEFYLMFFVGEKIMTTDAPNKRICHLLHFVLILSYGDSMWRLHSFSRLLQSIRCQPSLKVMAIELTISLTRCVRNSGTHYMKRVLTFILMVLSILLIRRVNDARNMQPFFDLKKVKSFFALAINYD